MARFLVERYLACPDDDTLAVETDRDRQAAAVATACGTPVHYLRSIYLPADETCLSMFEAPRREDVVDAFAAANLSILRVGDAVELEDDADQSAQVRPQMGLPDFLCKGHRLVDS